MQRILVIDDDPDLRDVLSRTLARAGYEVISAEDGQKARALYRSHPPDIVVTDIYMPNTDGLEALMELRRTLPHVKVIAISGGVAKQNILQVATALGASCTLSKPFEPGELLDAVARLANG